MAEPARLDLGRAAAYVRGMADAARQALACDPDQNRTIRLGGDFSVILAGRPGDCGPNSRNAICIPGLEAGSRDTVTIRDLGSILAKVVRVADVIHQALGRGGGGVTRDDIEEIGEIVGPPPL